MKIVAFLILTGFSIISLQAQRPVYTANLDFYAGTWKYENQQTGEEFVLKLRKTSFVDQNVTRECVVGAYTYKKNGLIVVDCMNQFSSTQTSPRNMPVYANNGSLYQDKVNPNELRMFVTDFGKFAPNGDTKRTRINELLLVSNASPNKIRWILKDDGGAFEANELPPNGFSIPEDMILIKQP